MSNIILACELASTMFLSPATPNLKNNSSNHVPACVSLDDVKQMVGDIHQSANAAVRVLNDALNLQKLQSGAFDFVIQPFCLHDLVASSMRMVQPQMTAKHIDVSH